MSGTMFFSDEQVGKYIRLLCAQHLTGRLSEKHMLNICKTYDEDIFSKFEKDEAGKFYNVRLEREILKRKNYSESRRNNRKSYDLQDNTKNNNNNISISYDKHMGNGNGNGIGIGIENIINECLKKIQLKKDDSREFHNAVFESLKNDFKLNCLYEYEVPEGRVDLVVIWEGQQVGIELDNRIPRSKSILKLKSNFKKYFLLVRNPKENYNYLQFENCLLYKNGFSSSNDSSDHPYVLKIKKNYPRLLKMDEPLTNQEAEKLEIDIGDEPVYQIIEAMANWKPLLKNNSSVNITLRKWHSKDQEKNKQNGNNPTGKTERIGRMAKRDVEEFIARPIIDITSRFSSD